MSQSELQHKYIIMFTSSFTIATKKENEKSWSLKIAKSTPMRQTLHFTVKTAASSPPVGARHNSNKFAFHANKMSNCL